MDKIAANNHFVTLRKEIKKAKAMVSGKLIRKIKELKKEIESVDDETKTSKTQNKIEATYEDIKLLKTLDSYLIAKQATLKSDKEHWNKLASHSKASHEERLTALVICKNNIQKQIAKFRDEHQDCDEWLEEYIEYREKKHELIRPMKRSSTKKGKDNGSKRANHQGGPDKMRNSKDKPTRNPRHKKSTNQSKRPDVVEKSFTIDSDRDEGGEEEALHPSWASKKKEKNLMKELVSAALAGKIERLNRKIFE